MDFINEVLDALDNLARKLIDLLSGPEAEPELEPIPIPVRNRQYRQNFGNAFHPGPPWAELKLIGVKRAWNLW